jgi:hypothetical protein
MKPSTLALIAMWGTCVKGAAADATSPVDYTQRNQPYAPTERVVPSKQKPAANTDVQEKRVEPVTVDKKKSSLQEREAAVDVKEARPKQVREKESKRPEAVEHTTSDYNHRPAAISTATDSSKPRIVSKYQDSMAAAPTWGGVRAGDPAATAKINRFVFRKNPSEPAAAVKGGPVIPAAGGSPLQK